MLKFLRVGAIEPEMKNKIRYEIYERLNLFTINFTGDEIVNQIIKKFKFKVKSEDLE